MHPHGASSLGNAKAPWYHEHNEAKKRKENAYPINSYMLGKRHEMAQGSLPAL